MPDPRDIDQKEDLTMALFYRYPCGCIGLGAPVSENTDVVIEWDVLVVRRCDVHSDPSRGVYEFFWKEQKLYTAMGASAMGANQPVPLDPVEHRIFLMKMAARVNDGVSCRRAFDLMSQALQEHIP